MSKKQKVEQQTTETAAQESTRPAPDLNLIREGTAVLLASIDGIPMWMRRWSAGVLRTMREKRVNGQQKVTEMLKHLDSLKNQ